MDDIQQLTAKRLREVANSIEERDKKNRSGTTMCQRLHAKELPLVLSALRGWANYVETSFERVDNK